MGLFSELLFYHYREGNSAKIKPEISSTKRTHYICDDLSQMKYPELIIVHMLNVNIYDVPYIKSMFKKDSRIIHLYHQIDNIR